MATVAKPAIGMEGAEPVTEAVLKFRLRTSTGSGVRTFAD